MPLRKSSGRRVHRHPLVGVAAAAAPYWPPSLRPRQYPLGIAPRRRGAGFRSTVLTMAYAIGPSPAVI